MKSVTPMLFCHIVVVPFKFFRLLMSYYSANGYGGDESADASLHRLRRIIDPRVLPYFIRERSFRGTERRFKATN